MRPRARLNLIPNLLSLQNHLNSDWVRVWVKKTLAATDQSEIEFSYDISTGQYQSSSGLLRYHEFTEIYMK